MVNRTSQKETRLGQVEGDYWRDYAGDPTEWVLTELTICRKWYHLFMRMVGADPAVHHRHEHYWMPSTAPSGHTG